MLSHVVFTDDTDSIVVQVVIILAAPDLVPGHCTVRPVETACPNEVELYYREPVPGK